MFTSRDAGLWLDVETILPLPAVVGGVGAGCVLSLTVDVRSGRPISADHDGRLGVTGEETFILLA